MLTRKLRNYIINNISSYSRNVCDKEITIKVNKLVLYKKVSDKGYVHDTCSLNSHNIPFRDYYDILTFIENCKFRKEIDTIIDDLI